MKAKEYVTFWNSWQENRPTLKEIYSDPPEERRDEPAENLDLVTHLCQKLLQEYQLLAEARQAQTPEALGSILKELVQKYKAICNRVEGLHPDFFEIFLKHRR